MEIAINRNIDDKTGDLEKLYIKKDYLIVFLRLYFQLVEGSLSFAIIIMHDWGVKVPIWYMLHKVHSLQSII